MWSAVLNFVAFVLIHPPHRRIALSLEFVFQMMAKHFGASQAQVTLLGDCKINSRAKCRAGIAAAAYFGWMREAKRDNTRCGLRR